MDNIILMGPPGAGKTTVANILKNKLNINWIDVDDDLLEKHWSKSVAETLSEIGDNAFLKKEAETTLKLNQYQGVISLSGSNPLDEKAMKHVKSLGQVFYLDVDVDIITKRLEQMKVDRIVGMKEITLKQILEYRQSFYEKSYDVKIKVTAEMSAENIANQIIEHIPKSKIYVSTRGQDIQYGFANVIEQGLARDGGLYVPSEIPSMSAEEIYNLKSLNYLELCDHVLSKFHLGFETKRMIEDAYAEFQDSKVTPVKPLGDKNFVLELFHGPTAAFKDLALQLTPRLIEKATELKPEARFVLAATSGDTGVAAISGFSKVKNAQVCVLYPSKGVSPIQKQQMLSCQSERVKILAVEGDFDHCQSMVKDLFSDLDFQTKLKTKGYKLTAANSINWGRLLPQVVYYFYAYLKLLKENKISKNQKLDFVVPTGNFGNILAGYVAKQMGLPIGQLICASNKNNILTEFIQTGCYDIRNKKLFQTASPSIDILKSSNIERAIFWLSGNNSELTKKCFEDLKSDMHFEVDSKTKKQFKETFLADFATEEQCLEAIKSAHKDYSYLLDPHTAVAYYVYKKQKSNNHSCLVSTAHYGKFPIAMQLVENIKDVDQLYDHFLKKTDANPKIHNKLWEVVRSKADDEVSFSGDSEQLKQVLLKQV